LRLSCFGLVFLLAESCVRFVPRPISAPRTLDDFEARRLDSPDIQDYFKSQPAVGAWPPQSWDLRALTLAAIYYHPDLDVARAQWGVARAGRITAGERPNPAATGLVGYNSTTPVSEITPWIPEAVLEIPIETAGKRGYRISEARHFSEAARLSIRAVAWEVRSRLRQAFLELFSARQTEAFLESMQSLQSEDLKILEAQLAVGEAAIYEVTQTRIALDNIQLAVLEASRQSALALVKLADAIGIPAQSLAGMDFSFEGLARVQPEYPPAEVRRSALVNRADILAALSEYEASQSALRLEIAKQYPDLNIGAGYQLDQTDSKWTLSLNLILPILNRNRGPIAEAEARRQECAARFLALQAKVIGDIDGAIAAIRPAIEKAKMADGLQASIRKREAAARLQYDLGEISKLELLGVQLELASSQLARLEAVISAQRAVGELEDTLQSPLNLRDWLLEPPRKVTGQTKEQKDE
jgi:outer membrane protein TolC